MRCQVPLDASNNLIGKLLPRSCRSDRDRWPVGFLTRYSFSLQLIAFFNQTFSLSIIFPPSPLRRRSRCSQQSQCSKSPFQLMTLLHPVVQIATTATTTVNPLLYLSSPSQRLTAMAVLQHPILSLPRPQPSLVSAFLESHLRPLSSNSLLPHNHPLNMGPFMISNDFSTTIYLILILLPPLPALHHPRTLHHLIPLQNYKFSPQTSEGVLILTQIPLSTQFQ